MALTEQWVTELVNQLKEIVKEISGLQHERRVAFKIMHGNFIRRIKLLSPLFAELKFNYRALDDEDAKGLVALKISFQYALKHLKWLTDSSKLYQVLRMDVVADEFNNVSGHIEGALSEIPYHKLDMEEEVLEQIEFVHAQFRRAKERRDSPDLQLERDLAVVLTDDNPDPAILERLSEKLQLQTVNDLKRESLAFDEMVITSGGEPAKLMKNMSSLLMKLKDYVQVNNPGASSAEDEKMLSPFIPYDFQCPISFQLLEDPVIVSTGQTYERSCIEKWLDAGHKRCPKTQQKLSRMALMTPNYVLKSLIANWCESNDIKLPKKDETGPSEGNTAVINVDTAVQSAVVGDDGSEDLASTDDEEVPMDEGSSESSDDEAASDYDEASEDESISEDDETSEYESEHRVSNRLSALEERLNSRLLELEERLNCLCDLQREQHAHELEYRAETEAKFVSLHHLHLQQRDLQQQHHAESEARLISMSDLQHQQHAQIQAWLKSIEATHKTILESQMDSRNILSLALRFLFMVVMLLLTLL